MRIPVFVLIASLGAAGSVSAQTVVDSGISETGRQQVRVFERNLMTAIEGAARQMAERVQKLVPDGQFQLQFQTDPVVTSVVIPDVGPVFSVQIPAIEGVSLAIIENRYQQSQRPLGGTPMSGGVSAPDSIGSLERMLANRDKEYTEIMRTSLIDALLDNSLALAESIPAGQSLTVVADAPTRDPNPNRLAPPSRKLVLSIRSEDLLALRKNNLSREDARAKIRESRY